MDNGRKSTPWDSYKKDVELDHRIKGHREYLKHKRYQRQYSRGTAPLRAKGEPALLQVSRKYASIRAASSEKPSLLKHKVLSDLPVKQQLEILKRKNIKRRDVWDSDSEEEESGSEEEKEQEEGKEKGKQERGEMRANSKNLGGVRSKERLQQANDEDDQKRKSVDYTAKHRIRLKLDEFSEDPSHVSFDKLDRLTKVATSSYVRVPLYRRSDVNRLDQAIAKWTLKV